MNEEVIIQSEKIEEYFKGLPAAGPFGEEVAVNEKRSVIVSRNITSAGEAAKAEIHDNYTDIFLILEGEETVYIGGVVDDKQETAPGEWRGEKLTGANEYRIKAGDKVIIPKGVPHKHGVGVIKMMVVKIA